MSDHLYKPVPWQSVIQAILAVDAEASRRGEMFPQTADEQRVDRKAATRVVEMVTWYANHGGSVAERLKDWPQEAVPVVPACAPGFISVDVFALAKLLAALTSPDYFIREMQATRSLHKLGHPNPIETLLDQVNAWAEADAKKGGVA